MSADFPRFALFDLDGTLIDGVEDLVSAINVVLQAHQLAPLNRSMLEPMLGDGMRTLVFRAFTSRGFDLDQAGHDDVYARFIQAYQNTGYQHTRLYDGARHMLELLKSTGWNIGLASNKLTAPCRKILGNLGVSSLFDAIVGSDLAPTQKPAGAHLGFALECMGARAESAGVAVMVGDHRNDVNAARQIGIPVIAVSFNGNPQQAARLGADCHVTGFAELHARLCGFPPRSPLFRDK